MRAQSILDRLWLSLSDRIGVESRVMYLYRLDAEVWRAAECTSEADADWSLLGPADIPLLTAVSNPDLTEAALRLDRGDKCYVARLSGADAKPALAHHSWVQSSGVHPITEAGISRLVEHGAFWIYHCHTAEWARGHQLYPTALARIVREHFQAGFKTAWIYTQDSNTASQHGIERSQFQRVATMRAVRAGRYYLPVKD